jgi:hypothetical protein
MSVNVGGIEYEYRYYEPFVICISLVTIVFYIPLTPCLRYHTPKKNSGLQSHFYEN